MNSKTILILGSIATMGLLGLVVYKIYFKKNEIGEFSLEGASENVLQQPSQLTPFKAPEPVRNDFGSSGDQPWSATSWVTLATTTEFLGDLWNEASSEDPLEVDFPANTAYIN